MPSFTDLGSPDNHEFDWDVTPEEEMEDEGYGYDGIDDWVEEQEDWDGHIYHQDTEDDPGAGDSYQGTDPTVFDEQEQISDEETATIPDKGDQSFGSGDDVESQEHPSDEAVGDDEDDDSDPALIYESPNPAQDDSLASDVTMPEQGQASQETTTREPTRPVIDYEDLLAELMESAKPQDWSEDWPHPPREAVIDPVESIAPQVAIQDSIDFYSLAPGLEGANYDEGLNANLLDYGDNLQHSHLVNEEKMFWSELKNNVLVTEVDVYGIITDEYARSSRSFEQFGYFMTTYGEGEGEIDEGPETFDLLIPMSTADFIDVTGSIDMETLLTEFQLIEQDDI